MFLHLYLQGSSSALGTTMIEKYIYSLPEYRLHERQRRNFIEIHSFNGLLATRKVIGMCAPRPSQPPMYTLSGLGNGCSIDLGIYGVPSGAACGHTNHRPHQLHWAVRSAWLIGAVACLCAAPRDLFANAGINLCQLAAASKCLRVSEGRYIRYI